MFSDFGGSGVFRIARRCYACDSVDDNGNRVSESRRSALVGRGPGEQRLQPRFLFTRIRRARDDLEVAFAGCPDGGWCAEQDLRLNFRRKPQEPSNLRQPPPTDSKLVGDFGVRFDATGGDRLIDLMCENEQPDERW